MKEVCIKESAGETLEIVLSGDIDAGNAEAFYGEVMTAYEDANKNICFDCAALAFIDSTTLGTFVKITKRLKADGYTVRLVGAQAKIKKLFLICALDKIMEIA
ncbi:MAG: STAS domain-containing protein [Clostridia bacterium]|nr:STAS domain-containing protein [Clostridia bacterium]